MTGCATVQNTEQNSTRGLLLCAPNEICPIVKVNWNEQDLSTFKVNVLLDNPTIYYDIQSISFENGQKSHSFTPIAPTLKQFVYGNYRSNSSIITPMDIMADFKGSDAISMKIVTDKGTISRYIYKDGQESSVYKQLKQVKNS